MKKFLVLPLLLMAAAQLKAQSVLFKMVYQPKTTYTINKQIKTNMTMAAPGELKSLGGGQDLVMGMSMTTTSTITTSGRDQNKVMPIKLISKTNSAKMTMNGQEMPGSAVPFDALSIKVYGKYSPDNKLTIDSVSGQQFTDSLRIAMTKLMDEVQEGLKFPDHPLKPGDTFTQELPFAMPMPGAAGGKLTMKMNYKLASVTNNIATFSFTENLVIAAGKDNNMSGFGNGTLTYNISKQFFTTMINNVNMTFDLSMGDDHMKGKGLVSTIDRVTIAGN